MTAAITAPTETSEPLAPAGHAAPGRGPAGAFDLLIALLQTQLPPVPGVPTSIVATPLPATPVAATPPVAGTVGLNALVNDAAAADADPAGLLQAPSVLALRVPGDLVPGDAASDDAGVVTSQDDEDAPDGVGDLSAEAAVAALGVAIVPLESDAPRLASLPSATPRIENGALAREITPSTGSEIGLAPSEVATAGLADAFDAVDTNARTLDATHGNEPLTPPDAGITAALEPRSRVERSMRTVDAFRATDAAAALASAREDVVQRLAAATLVPQGTAAAEAGVDRFGGASQETEREGTGPIGDGALGAAPIPGSALAPREAAAIAESSRPEPVRDPIDQIATRLRDVRGPGRHEISVRLDPPDLGAVRIDARLDGARLSLSIVAEHAPTGELLADALPRLRETLSQQGFVPTDVTVHLGFEAGGRQFTRDDAPTFTPPRDGELAPSSPAVRLPAARAAVTSDGLDVWA
jgi:flagellar hook-length control protein FliK